MKESERLTASGFGDTMSFNRISSPGDDYVHHLTVTAEDAAAVAALPPGSALLIEQRGAGERFLLIAPQVMAGRSVKADIFLDDVTVSRKHAEFRKVDGGYTVRDVGSLNGTYVNRERINTEILLRSGDEVQIGKFRMSYQFSPNS
jgi:pSer/pThr/pTyr-binding forkhead associated (FHA) protein